MCAVLLFDKVDVEFSKAMVTNFSLLSGWYHTHIAIECMIDFH